MARATAQETADRVELLAGMILAGSNNTECLVYARQTWGVSRAQGYKLVKRAWAQIKDDIEGPAHLLLPRRLVCGVGVGVAECVKEMMTVQ